MTEQEKQKLLEEEKGYYIECETSLRALLRFPRLTQREIESHMKCCEDYLNEYLSDYKNIYHKVSPFALKFNPIHKENYLNEPQKSNSNVD